MAPKNAKRNDDKADDQAPNKVLALAAILLSIAIVAVLVGGVVYWLRAPSPQGPVALPTHRPFAGTPGDRIALKPGSLKRWNVLLISADTTRADRVGCYGNPAIQTPAIDGLARQGILFAHAFTPVPITLPGHASMLTGLNPPRHGARSNGLFKLNDEAVTLAARLKPHGYATGAAIGAFVLDSKFGLSEGFDAYDDELDVGKPTTQFGYPERTADRVNGVAIDWIRRHAKVPFFYFVHYFDPHSPYRPPAPFDEQYKHNPYDGEIAYVDGQIGRLLTVLDELDIRRRTLVIFTSDHGESLGEHGEKTHAVFIYDATQHVPLIFSAPAPLPQNVIVSRHVGLIDIVPTVLAMVGAPVPPGLDGISLLNPPKAGDRAIYLETLYPKLTHNWAPLLGIRRGRYKFIHAPTPELYDLQTDPRELTNLYEANVGLAGKMHEILREMLGADPETATDVRANLAVDEKTRSMLEDLGYIVPSQSSRPATRTASGPVRLPDPKDMVEAYVKLVGTQSMVMEGRYAEALEHVKAYLALSPNDPEGSHIAGQIYRHLGRLDESMTWYRKAAALGYQPCESWAGIGSILLLQKKPDLAEKAYDAALKIDPHSPTALIGIGSVYSVQRREAEALLSFENALKYGHGINAAMAYLGISNVHRLAGRNKEADAFLAKAVQADPTNPTVSKIAAKYSVRSGNTDQAIERLRRAAEANPTGDVLLELGQLLNQQKQYELAATVLRRGISIAPDVANLHYELGMALVGLNQIQDAAREFGKAVNLDPKHGDAMSQLGIQYAKAGQFREALQFMKRAVAVKPESHSAHYNLALVLANLKAYDQAVQSLNKSLELNPDNAQAHCKLGLVLDQQGKRAEAVKHYRKALEIDPTNAEAKELLKASGK